MSGPTNPRDARHPDYWTPANYAHYRDRATCTDYAYQELAKLRYLLRKHGAGHAADYVARAMKSVKGAHLSADGKARLIRTHLERYPT